MNFKIVKPSTDAQRTTQTTLDTIEVTPSLSRSWKIPPFQRELRINDKVMLLAEQIKREDGVMPGVFTLGVLGGVRYLIDGQHRRDQFTKCMMSLSADSSYLDWLVGRQVSQRDVSPAYARIKSVFAKRLETDTGKKTALPQPPWASSSSAR